MHQARKTRGATKLILVLAFLTIIVAVSAAHLIAQSRSRAIQSSVDLIVENSMVSIRIVEKMGMDLQAEQVLVDRHIFEHDAVDLALTERQIAARRGDFAAGAARYDGLATYPHEANTWRELKADVASVERLIDAALVLSRKNLDEEAQAALVSAEPRRASIERKIEALVQINQVAADDGMRKVRALQASAQRLRSAVHRDRLRWSPSSSGPG